MKRTTYYRTDTLNDRLILGVITFSYMFLFIKRCFLHFRHYNTVTLFLSNKNMKRLIIWFIIIFLSLCLFTELTHWQSVKDTNQFMARQIESVRMERSWLDPYNAEMDKSLGIQIDLLCEAWGRSLSQCRLQMMYETGHEYRKGSF